MTVQMLVFYMFINNFEPAPGLKDERFDENVSPDSTGTLPVTEVTAEKTRNTSANARDYGYYRTEYQYLTRVLVRHAFYLLVGVVTMIIGVIALNKVFSYIHHSRIRRETLTIPLHHIVQRKPCNLVLVKRSKHGGSSHTRYPPLH